MATTTFARDRRFRRFDGDRPPGGPPGGPPQDRDDAERERRMGFIERRIDRLVKRIDALERIVKTDAIAPLDGPTNAGDT